MVTNVEEARSSKEKILGDLDLLSQHSPGETDLKDSNLKEDIIAEFLTLSIVLSFT
jgi:hypothetical protein